MMLLSFIFSWCVYSFAGDIDTHRVELQEIVQKTDAAEIRLAELKEKKTTTAEGDEQEEILDEIATLHKQILQLRQKKSQLTAHLRKLHPKDDLLTDLILRHTVEKDKSNQGSATKDDTLDARLDGLLNRIQAQYIRTAKERKTFDPNAGVADASGAQNPAAPTQKKQILQADKDKYLKEALKQKIKVKSE